MGKITFVPVGGLANRMRAVASAVMLAGKTKSELSIIWFQDWALNAPFYQLFKPVDREVASFPTRRSSDLFTGCFAVGLCIIRQTSFQEFSFPAFVSETAFQVLSVRAFHYSFM